MIPCHLARVAWLSARRRCSGPGSARRDRAKGLPPAPEARVARELPAEGAPLRGARAPRAPAPVATVPQSSGVARGVRAHGDAQAALDGVRVAPGEVPGQSREARRKARAAETRRPRASAGGAAGGSRRPSPRPPRRGTRARGRASPRRRRRLRCRQALGCAGPGGGSAPLAKARPSSRSSADVPLADPGAETFV